MASSIRNQISLINKKHIKRNFRLILLKLNVLIKPLVINLKSLRVKETRSNSYPIALHKLKAQGRHLLLEIKLS